MNRGRLTIIVLLSTGIAHGCLMSTVAATAPSYDKKMQLGQLLYFNNSVDQAIKAFRKAAELKPTALEPHLNLVNIFVQHGDLEQAIEECHAILAINQKHKDVHLILGNLLRSQANKESNAEKQGILLNEAQAEVRTAGSLGASPSFVENDLGVIAMQRGDHEEAMQHLEKALTLKRNLPDAHLFKGVLHFKRGENEQALKHLDDAILFKNGRHDEAWHTKASVLYSMNRLDEALDAYAKAVELNPRRTSSWEGMAAVYQKKNQPGKAQEIFDQLHKRVTLIDGKFPRVGDFDLKNFNNRALEQRIPRPTDGCRI